jgi:hypothetical protein
MYQLYQMAKTFGKRPAEFFFEGPIQGDLIAYQFDRAVFLWGARVENRYNETDKKGKRTRTLEEAMEKDNFINIGEMNLSDEEKINAVLFMLG